MILQSLNAYYQRKMADHDPQRRLPLFGFEHKEIPFILEISKEGELLGIKDTRSIEGKKKIAQRFLVPKGIKKTSGVAANLLWDTAEYVLGMDTKDKSERIALQKQAFQQRIDTLHKAIPDETAIVALLNFLDKTPLAAVQASEYWDEIREVNPVLTFRMAGDVDLICQRNTVVSALISLVDNQEENENQVCLLTGTKAPVERLHSSIKGVWGAQSSGANIVSFNLDAFASFGKEQGRNAPVSEIAAFSYTTALNHLLAKNSRQRIQVGDTSTVFWAQEQDDLENSFSCIFGDTDNPDNTEALRAVLESVQSGKFDGARGEKEFYVLGLAPNAARISIRFWQATKIRDMAQHIRAWFEDLSITRAPHDPEFPSLFRLLTACAVQNKADNIPPNLGGDIMRSILAGAPYPVTWLNAAVQRSRAEQNVTYYRAAAIKACLNRGQKYKSDEKEFNPMLDIKNMNVAYRLGRLFAALEKLQEEANPGLNATIRDRYYGAASSTPVAVFTTLLRLKNHHVGKLDSKGRATNFEKLFGEILDGINDFPAHLALPDQGRFALGYYQQRQAFFNKSE